MSEPDFRALFGSTPALNLVLDPQFRVVAVTDAYLAATHARQDQVLGRSIFDVFPDDAPGDSLRNLRASLERVRRTLVPDVMPVQRFDIPVPGHEDDGVERRFWSAATSPVLRPDGSLAHLLHRVEDVTDFVRAGEAVASDTHLAADTQSRTDAIAAEVFARNQEVAETSRQLKEANADLARMYETTRELAQDKSQFFAAVSHELRTPLTLIMAPLERQLATTPADDPRRPDLELMNRNARVLLRHVNDLLDAARLDASGIRLNYSDVDLAELTRLVSAFFESRALDRDITLSVVSPESIPAQVDPEQVRRVLFNLLGNAFTFTPDGGTIRLELRQDGGRIAFDVADSGPGVAGDEREVIFERFRQGRASGARPARGTGLGLSIVRDLVTLHGGTVSVEDAPEGGALFTVRLPTQAPPDATVLETVPLTWDDLALPRETRAPVSVGIAAEDGDQPHVLVIEDNPELNRLVAESLAPAYRVSTALNGRDGLDLAMRLRPDLIICDVMMPLMRGEDVVANVRRASGLEATAILVLSARADETQRLELLRAGANDYLVKPFTVDELRARADNLVALSRAEERLRVLRVTDDRDRIARDLHDLVIQRLFAIGMRLDAVQRYDMNPIVHARISETVEDLDVVIQEIRSTIFDLQRGLTNEGLRSGAMALTVDAAQRIGCPPRITFTGPVDTLVSPEVAAHALAVLQEALSNAVRHSLASTVEVVIDASVEQLVVTVRDDGVGPPDGPTSGDGLRNMAARADGLGGRCTVRPNAPLGTEVRWAVPLTD